MLVESPVVFELIGEVENDVGSETLELLLDQIEIVEDGQVGGRVAEFAECGENVRFGLPILGL